MAFTKRRRFIEGQSNQAHKPLKQVRFLRQIEISELMVSANNFNAGYAEASVLGTPKDKLAQPEKPKIKAGLSAEEIGKIARGWNP